MQMESIKNNLCRLNDQIKQKHTHSSIWISHASKILFLERNKQNQM